MQYFMKKYSLSLAFLALFCWSSQPASSQVSNDNEDGVNKVDQRFAKDFVPGQVLVKFKDTSTISVKRNAKGRFQAANDQTVDKLLKDYGVNDMEKLFPAEVAKPKASLRRKAAPNGTIVEEKNLDKIFWIKTQIQGADSTMQLIKKLQAMPEVEYAEPNYLSYITADVPAGQYEGESRQSTRAKAPVVTETDAEVICSSPTRNPLYFRQYGITQQKIHKLWNKPIINKKRPVIAILDTGVDINHPDLVDNIWQNSREVDGETAFDDDGNGIVDDKFGWNFVEDYYDLTDRNGHGTHCAGIAAAADNGIGIVGANPLALIMPVKVMSDRGVGDDATIARGIVYAAENGADIISMSIGGAVLSNTQKNALDRAYQTAVLVAAAGNNGKDIYNPIPSGTSYPAAYYLVLGVEASGSNLQRAGFSNYDPDGPIYSEDGVDGRNYEVQVPGVDIYSTLPDGKYNKLSGTSMSTPLFAGAISALQMVKEYPSKDVLYSDLIYLKADFEKIYSDDTPRTPKIDLITMTIDDNVESNNNVDGQVDVGEAILFTPVLRNTWADATDINLKLTVDPVYADYVEIENSEVAFGYSLSAYGRATAKTPIKVRFANNIGDNTRIKFLMEVSCAEGTESFTQDVYVTVNNMVKISGLISEDRTLTSDHVYYVNENLGIMEGATLTIEPGTRLEFAEGMGLSSFGKLVANGTPEKPIVFTGHKGAVWAGIKSHESTGVHNYEDDVIYTNDEQTLFTLLPTEMTPNRFSSKHQSIYSGDNYGSLGKNFYLYNYLKDFESDMTSRQDLLTDPDYLTSAVLQMLSDWEAYWSQYPTQYSDDKPYSSIAHANFLRWYICDNPRDTISNCKLEYTVLYEENSFWNWNDFPPYMKDCVYESKISHLCTNFYRVDGIRNNIIGIDAGTYSYGRGLLISESSLLYSNIVNNFFGSMARGLPKYSDLKYTNYFNNYAGCDDLGKYYGKNYSLCYYPNTPGVDKSEYPSYTGTSREDLVRPYIFEMGNAPYTYGQIDLSNMPTRPYAEAHGIVWKVCVNGKDAQDEFEGLAPLGVGRHKFEVYYNRPMNVAVAPKITFGVREPYTQHEVAEDGEWSADSLIYTAYITITGKTSSDGLNRIYVQGGEDNEYFECPYEKSRFNINIQAAGSMATGFAAEAGLGRVDLTWNNDENDFDDAMGFNIYRYTEEEKLMPVLDEWGNEIPEYDENGNWQFDENGDWIRKKELRMVRDTICLNREIVDIETTAFTDYDVTPGKTYYYYYKVLSTDLQEYDVSNVVAATPLTATLGDANGSGDVDVADVITTVNQITGMEPKPFIFEAADVNVDLMIDVLDVIGIIQKILNPGANTLAMSEAEATYTIEDGTLYVESPVALAGIQVQLSLTPDPSSVGEGRIIVAEDLKGFEHTSAWLSDNDYLFLAYNMNGKTLTPGKHALLHIGDAMIAQIRLSDANGHNILVNGDDATKVNRMASDVMTIPGIYDMQGRKHSGNSEQQVRLPKGVYIINGQKVVR